MQKEFCNTIPSGADIGARDRHVCFVPIMVLRLDFGKRFGLTNVTSASGRCRRPVRTAMAFSRRPSLRAVRSGPNERQHYPMKNGLYSVHIYMLDGVRGRDSGVLVLRNGVLLGGGPYFWSIGSYTVADRTWSTAHQSAHALSGPLR